MIKQLTCWLVLLSVVLLAVGLRFYGLKMRPMHGDEAVHAVKFARLLDENHYRYDSFEYHGPTLNYLSLLGVKLFTNYDGRTLTDSVLRFTPAFFGVLVILLTFSMKNVLGKTNVLLAALLTAISPAFVFYSRYYIQEMLLLFFSFAAVVSGYFYIKKRQMVLAALTGVCLGLMYSTKETCVIAFGCMFVALLLTALLNKGRRPYRTVEFSHVVVAAMSFLVISFLFYSSFLTNISGFGDSFLAFSNYLGRASQNQTHIHPWYYYLKMLFFAKYFDGPIWTEALIVIFYLIAIVQILKRNVPEGCDLGLLRFLTFYSIAMTVVYSAIPYKTPWCMLGFFHGMILLAPVGMSFLTDHKAKILKLLSRLFIAVAVIHLTWQCLLANFRYYEDSRNPYVYAHPLDDVFL